MGFVVQEESSVRQPAAQSVSVVRNNRTKNSDWLFFLFSSDL